MLATIKGEINSMTIIVGNIKTPHIPMDRSSREKINKETQALNDTLDKLNLIEIYRHFIQKQQLSFSFLITHGIFSKIDYILVHTSSLGKFFKSE